MDIYLDIDGVLLHTSLANNGKPANYALEFLEYITTSHTCFWLTTHCHGGENRVNEYLTKRLPEAKIYLDKILPTDWRTWKTDAIDFSKDFRWIDDDVYEPERAELLRHNTTGKLILVDLNKNPNQLRDIVLKV